MRVAYWFSANDEIDKMFIWYWFLIMYDNNNDKFERQQEVFQHKNNSQSIFVANSSFSAFSTRTQFMVNFLNELSLWYIFEMNSILELYFGCIFDTKSILSAFPRHTQSLVHFWHKLSFCCIFDTKLFFESIFDTHSVFSAFTTRTDL